MNTSKKEFRGLTACAAAAFVAVFASLGAGAGAAPAKITLDVASAGKECPATLWGAFFEDINWAADGGIWPELLANAGFDWGQDDHEKWNCRDDGWEGDFRDGGMARLSFQYGAPVHPNTAKHLRIETFGTGLAGVRNRGYDGIFLANGAKYRLSFLWREIARDGIDYAYGPWQEFAAEFEAGEGVKEFALPFGKAEIAPDAKAEDARSTFSILVKGRRAVEIEMASLKPLDTIAGFRRDLVEKLAALRPAFLRFPGGCIVEGGDFQHWYDWRRTVGPRERRECVLNRWSRPRAPYWETFGLGYYEYFLLCEAIGAEPLPICLAGITCQYQKPAQYAAHEDADFFAQAVLDLVEFANGAIDTKWGRVRAEMGHPEPFGLKMVGVGNENWGQGFLDRSEAITKIVKAAHPEIKIVGSSGPSPDGKDFDLAWRWYTDEKAWAVDEHYYREPEWFLKAAKRYDSYAREGKPKVYVGEYACHDRDAKKANNLYSAICEAAAMTGFERNCDVVVMASYAPLFARYGHSQWHPNLIWFDGTRSVATPNYYVQQMFALNRPARVLAAEDNLGADEKELFYTAGVDDAALETVVKLVNASGSERDVELNLAGEAEICVLAGEKGDENTLEGEKVSPVREKVDFGGRLTLKPWSFTILRVKAAK